MQYYPVFDLEQASVCFHLCFTSVYLFIYLFVFFFLFYAILSVVCWECVFGSTDNFCTQHKYIFMDLLNVYINWNLNLNWNPVCPSTRILIQGDTFDTILTPIRQAKTQGLLSLADQFLQNFAQFLVD
jgi:hypothetical protein